MAKKIIFICGSPRKGGNTNQLVKTAAEAAELAGADVTVVDATEISFSKPGCTGCMGCKINEEYRCVIDDDLSRFVETLPQYNVIVLASPLYWVGFTAQLKIVIDRMFCLMKFNEETKSVVSLLSGKTLGLLATSGGELVNNLEILDRQCKASTGFLSMKYDSLLVPLAPFDPANLADDDKKFQRAKDFGTKLAN